MYALTLWRVRPDLYEWQRPADTGAMSIDEKSPEAEPRDVLRGRVMIVIAAVLWSTSGLFGKSPLFDSWPREVDDWPVRGPLFAFWRASFACLILFPLVRKPQWTLKLIPGILIFAAMNVTYLTALTATTAANAIWLQNTAPLWVFLIGVFFLGERVHPRDGWLLAFVLAGLTLILSYELRRDGDGVTLAALSGFTYAGVVLSLRWLRSFDSAWLVALNHLGTSLLLLGYVLYRGIYPSGYQWLALLAFGVLQMGLPYWLFARGLRHVSGHEAAGLGLLEPLLVPLWVYIAWRHVPTYPPTDWWTFAGGGLILLGLLCRYVRLASRMVLDDQVRRKAEERN